MASAAIVVNVQIFSHVSVAVQAVSCVGAWTFADFIVEHMLTGAVMHMQGSC